MLLLWLSLSLFSHSNSIAQDANHSNVKALPPASAQAPKKDDYDALDGRGESKVRIDAIVWENNLELHVYPPDALAGLGITIDPKKKDILVASYRFAGRAGKTEIRRLLIDGAKLSANNLRVYLDKSTARGDDPTDTYDKYIITSNQLAGKLAEVKLDKAPTQLYPDGHPALGPPKDDPKQNQRLPAGGSEGRAVERPDDSSDTGKGPERYVDDNGSIKPFDF